MAKSQVFARPIQPFGVSYDFHPHDTGRNPETSLSDSPPFEQRHPNYRASGESNPTDRNSGRPQANRLRYALRKLQDVLRSRSEGMPGMQSSGAHFTDGSPGTFHCLG
jgi:hypothetical protein